MSDQPKIVIDSPKQNGAPLPFHPEIHISINEVDSKMIPGDKTEPYPEKQWVMDVACAVEENGKKGFMSHSFIGKSLEDLAKNIPEILKHVKEKFYA